jgi:hypothetical protein
VILRLSIAVLIDCQFWHHKAWLGRCGEPSSRCCQRILWKRLHHFLDRFNSSLCEFTVNVAELDQGIDRNLEPGTAEVGRRRDQCYACMVSAVDSDDLDVGEVVAKLMRLPGFPVTR